MTPTKELKKRAREALAEKMGTVILAFVVLIILSFGSGWISNTLFPENSKLHIALGYVFSFIISILINVISAGMLYMYLNIARNKEFSLNDLFYFFKKYPDRVITATFVLAFINVLTMLPYTIYGYSLPTDISDMNLLMEMAVKSGVLMIIGTVVYEIITIPLEMTYYILADNPQTKGMDALKESIEMMRGNFWRYFLLKLSFVPLMFLSVFTFYIAKEYPDHLYHGYYIRNKEKGIIQTFNTMIYPVNFARDLAIESLSTTHYLFIDCDFFTSETIYQNIRSFSYILSKPKTVLLIPTFQVNRQILKKCRDDDTCESLLLYFGFQ